jgi:hypothetical protein
MTKLVQNSRRGNGTGAGRTKGTPNKSTAQAREAIALLVEGNMDKMQGWLDQIAASDPKAAIDSIIKLMEYHVPKLARAELSGTDGEEIRTHNQYDITQLVLSKLTDEQLRQIEQQATNL